MKKIFTLIVSTIIISCIVSSCAHDSHNKELIVGKWKASEWLVKDAPSDYVIANTGFNFDKSGTYVFTYDGTDEKGTYIVKEDKLYTTPYEQQEIMVKINKLTTDSLVFEMNRGGQKETLTLLKAE